MTEIEITDPEPAPGDPRDPRESGAAGEPGEPGEDGESPYRNLLVPLIVVPALIVMVLVLVYVLFSSIVGSPASPRDNLEKLLNGGYNERQQAAFGLVGQILEAQHARREGREPEWASTRASCPGFVRPSTGPASSRDPRTSRFPTSWPPSWPQMGDPEGVQRMIELTRLSEVVDPGADYRLKAAFTLGAVGGDLAEPERLAAAAALISLLEGTDDGLVLVAAAGLQNLPGPRTTESLEGLLNSSRLDHRLQAALSLAQLGSAAGAGVLEALVHTEPYEQERASDPARWAPQRVSESRRKALEALLSLDRRPDAAQLELWAESDPDPHMREIARRLQADG